MSYVLHAPLTRGLRAAVGVFAMAALVPMATPLAAQGTRATADRTLSLDSALALAVRSSEALQIAQAGRLRAGGQYASARAQALPQVNGSISYQRQLQNQFAAIAAAGSSGSAPPDTTSGNSGGGTAAFTRVFASPNNVVLGVTATQNLFTGGRVAASLKAAAAGRRSADIGVATANAQLQYDVAQAYFDAVVADRLLAISDSSLQQAERSLKQTSIARAVGSSAEFDLLRARVARDNLRPQVYGALTQRDAAYARLKALLNIPLDAPVQLTTKVTEPDTAAINRTVAADLDAMRGNGAGAALVASADTMSADRLAVKQAAENVTAQRNLLSAARASRLPAIQLSTNYQRFAYPDDAGRGWTDYFPNWTVAAGLSVPIWTSGRLAGDIDVARANLIEAEQRLQQAKEGASFEARQAVNELRQAQASYLSSLGTDEQAARAYRIAEVRYAEGLSTQLELIESRNQLAQSAANRVTAARTLALAQLKLKLLKELPLGAGGGATGAAAGGGAPAAQMPAAQGGGSGGARATTGGTGGGALANVQGQN
ncbi:MAG: TolC family protein [Gemmatimonadaceae bacterium]|nr:TolC family protein [Gemmatimonadaceae bacterium]